VFFSGQITFVLEGEDLAIRHAIPMIRIRAEIIEIIIDSRICREYLSIICKWIAFSMQYTRRVRVYM